MNTNFPGQFLPIPSSFQKIILDNVIAQPLTLPSSVKGLPKYALIQALGSNVNWLDDGDSPTAVDGGGMFLNAFASPEGFLGNLSNVKFISTSVGGSTLLVSYYY